MKYEINCSDSITNILTVTYIRNGQAQMQKETVILINQTTGLTFYVTCIFEYIYYCKIGDLTITRN